MVCQLLVMDLNELYSNPPPPTKKEVCVYYALKSDGAIEILDHSRARMHWYCLPPRVCQLVIVSLNMGVLTRGINLKLYTKRHI